jgi:glycosyltransferase involved in cell wall biosynthesis
MNLNLKYVPYHKIKYKIVHLIVGLGDGGAEHTLYKIIAADQTNTHFVISLTSFGKYGKLLKKLDVPVFALGFKKYSINLFKIFNLFQIIKDIDPKIIQSWMYHADFTSSLIKIFFPRLIIIWNIRNTTYDIKDSFSRFFISRFCSLTSYLIPDIVIACGSVPMEEHVSIGYDKKKMKIIYNGVDIKKFRIQTFYNFDKYLGLKSLNIRNKPVLGMVARYDKQKGYDILLNSLSLLKSRNLDFCCVLIGLNIDENNLHLGSMISKYGLSSNIILLGQRNDLDILYNFIDILVLSSINGEGFPNVLIEAMACGTPCVATNVGESKVIIDQTGWIVPPSNSLILSQALENAISEINLPNWKIRQSNCITRVLKNYSLENMNKHYSKTWFDAIQSKTVINQK